MLRNIVTAQRGRAFAPPGARGQERDPGQWRARGSSALGADGLAPAAQLGADPALEVQGSTGSQDDF